MFHIAGGIILGLVGIVALIVVGALARALFERMREWWHHNNGVQ